MSRMPVKRHLSTEQLEGLIRREKDKRVLERLIFVRSLYDDETVAKAAAKLGRSKTAGYDWLKRWNEGGPERIKPTFNGGRPPKLSNEKRAKLKEELKERNDWTTKEISSLIEKEFGVSFSLRHMRRFLRSLKMRFAKPYPRDYRRPPDAEIKLQSSLGDALGKLDDLEAEKTEKDNVLVGFFDECSPQTSANSVRRWALSKPTVVKNTSKFKADTFGFYVPGAESVVEFKDDSKKASVCSFLEDVRKHNPTAKILMILDNFPSHKAQMTRMKAQELGIVLVFLPPHSPDLNPIEQIWRCLKRVLSTAFFACRDEFLAVIEKGYNELSASASFAIGWIQKFLPQQLKQLKLDQLCP